MNDVSLVRMHCAWKCSLPSMNVEQHPQTAQLYKRSHSAHGLPRVAYTPHVRTTHGIVNCISCSDSIMCTRRSCTKKIT